VANILERYFEELVAKTQKKSHYMYFNSCPLLDPLTEQWTTIRDEFENHLKKRLKIKHITTKSLLKQNDMAKKNYITDFFGEELYSGDFKSISMFLLDRMIDEHEAKAMNWPLWRQPGGNHVAFFENVIADMPTMEKWMMSNLDVLGGITFNICLPGSKLNHHWGLDPRFIRFHLVLKGAKGCVFDIENERHEWVDGELFGFDDAMVLHGTKNEGNDYRIIMLVDILKTEVEQYAKNWNCREFKPRETRKLIKIKDW
jgi:hypothetical protein